MGERNSCTLTVSNPEPLWVRFERCSVGSQTRGPDRSVGLASRNKEPSQYCVSITEHLFIMLINDKLSGRNTFV